jgi:LuxR family transcriptional regulator, maltose regulon positive regulatory protein
MMAAPPGSGKTLLLRSWLGEAGLAESAAWVSVGRDERDPQRLWLSVVDALGQTVPGSALVRPLTAAPDLNGWAIVERLLTDLAPLDQRLWLVIDDLHELGSDQARQQLELLVMRAPAELRFVLATRHDVRLGLHRLRLEGELAEIRAADLRFSLAEARALFAAAGVELAGPALGMLYERTEGWAAGLRLAALSLAGHPDPDRFAAEFSGSERTVAEYLLAEVLDRQSEQVRRLLLRTSVLERVNGELADVLTGDSGGERVLQDLEEANAFVVSLDPARSWFRYHRLFADLLQLELRRTGPGEVRALHELAAGWLAEHGLAVEAIRHAQAARDWGLAARLLADHWPSLYLGGRTATGHELMAGFPAGAPAADAELAAVAAADELAQGSLETAQRYLELAERGLASVPEGRRGQAQLLLGVIRMQLISHTGDQRARAEQAQRLLSAAEAPGMTQPLWGAIEEGTGRWVGGREELRALALIDIGDTETWTGRLDQAESHLEQAIALARRIGRPYLEFMGLTYRAEIELNRWLPRAAELSRQAIDLAERNGWTDDLFAGFAAMTLGAALAWQGRLDEAETWVQHAEQTFKAEANPAAAMGGHYVRGQLELGRGRAAEALAAFRAGERLAGPHPLARPLRIWLVHALVRLGEIDRAEQALASIGERDRDRGELRVATAVLRLTQDDPHGATVALAPVLDGSARVGWRSWLVEAFFLEAIARDALGDQAAAGGALERALDLAEPEGALLWFLLHPAPGLLERQAGQRVTPRSRFAPETGREQRLQRVSGVAQPAVTVIPVTDAAEFLRQRRGRGRDDPAGRGVGQALQGDDRPVDRLVVRPLPVSGMRTPLGPEIRRRGQGPLGVQIRHLRLVTGRPRQDERNPVARTHGEVRERGPVLAAQRDGGGQPDQVRPGNGVDFAANLPNPRNLPAVVEPQPQYRSHRHLAVQAHRDPDDMRRIRPGRHEVDDPHRAFRGDPVRLEHQGVACVPPGGARTARRGGERPVSGLVIAQQCGERGGRVETRQAEPVD